MLEGMETLTSWLFEDYLLSFRRASALECLAPMELGKHLSSTWYDTKLKSGCCFIVLIEHAYSVIYLIMQPEYLLLFLFLDDWTH